MNAHLLGGKHHAARKELFKKGLKSKILLMSEIVGLIPPDGFEADEWLLFFQSMDLACVTVFNDIEGTDPLLDHAHGLSNKRRASPLEKRDVAFRSVGAGS